MSIAITFGDMADPQSLSGAIYFSATTEYTRSYKGKLTEHPIESGAKIVDHFVSDNPVIKVSGIISSFDFSNIPSDLILDGMPMLNNQGAPTPVNVLDKGGSLKSLIPDVVTQFMPSLMNSVVQMDGVERTTFNEEIENFLLDLMAGVTYNVDRERWENRMTTSRLYMIDGLTPSLLFSDLVCTSVDVKENADTGEDLDLSFTFEQVKFVTTESADAPTPPKNTDTAKKTSKETSKGNTSGVTETVNKPPSGQDANYEQAWGIIKGS